MQERENSNYLTYKSRLSFDPSRLIRLTRFRWSYRSFARKWASSLVGEVTCRLCPQLAQKRAALITGAATIRAGLHLFNNASHICTLVNNSCSLGS